MKPIDFSIIEELNNFLNTHQLKRIRIKNADTEIELESHSISKPYENSTVITPANNTQTSTHPCITSPMIGTVYLSPNPDAKPFVDVGHTVEAGQVICIIEAMKMFTKIKSEHAGVISKVCIKNQQAVDFGQPLFEIIPHV